jgi:hypothetical protein
MGPPIPDLEVRRGLQNGNLGEQFTSRQYTGNPSSPQFQGRYFKTVPAISLHSFSEEVFETIEYPPKNAHFKS